MSDFDKLRDQASEGELHVRQILSLIDYAEQAKADRDSLIARLEQAERGRDEAREAHRITLTAACGEIERVGRFLGLQEEPEWNGLPGSVASQLIEGIAAMLDAVAAPLRADRDAWKARAEARPDITHEMARTCVEEWDDRCTVGGVHDGSTALPEWAPIVAALREHARTAVIGTTPCTDCEAGVCHRHRPTHTDMLAFAAAYDEDIRAEGRREMLWLMAVGLEMSCYLAQCSEHSMSEIWHGWLRNKALQALADMGDERARSMVET